MNFPSRKRKQAQAVGAVTDSGDFCLPCDNEFEELGSYFRKENLNLSFVIDWLYEDLQQVKLKPYERRILNAWLVKDVAHPCLSILGTGKEAPALRKLFTLVDRIALKNEVLIKREVPTMAFENLLEPYSEYNPKECIALIASARSKSESLATKKLCTEMLKSFEGALMFVNEVEAGLKGSRARQGRPVL